MASFAVQGYGHLRNSLRGSLLRCRCIYRYQSTSTETEATDSDDLRSDSEVSLDPARNVSRLSENQHRQYQGLPPELPYKDVRMRRKLFAKYGMASNEDPRIMWPSRSELLSLEEEERAEGVPLQERLATIQSEQESAKRARAERHKTIEKNMSQMPRLISEYRKRLQQAEKEVRDRQSTKEALLEEAREYFGYKIQANDPKFEQMMEERAEKEKKEAKKRKKEEKLKKAAAKLLQEAREMGQSTGKEQ
ncbi:growth arrest and DNA damage-inducible proteins-interacting protein 1 [Aplysia californica]|uniref:Large ribosomal subunit protein mL64 n=1 Tax=Aplysia californica TaxID=6500 RepID=A0ABM0K367_APLCA|nr:growth arrest and DNA damage-inducible proteins-interacting protein 1 [Aplysia californica]